jgi:hypothetical protein
MVITQSESPRNSSQPGRGDSPASTSLGIEVLVPNQATARAVEPDVVGRLARFFPDATPVRIPVKISRTSGDGNGHRDTVSQDTVFFQNTVIEFGTPREVLFVIDRPLEFADRVLIESKDGSLYAEASVVALQYHPERTAVAVRFLKHVPNWIVKS